MKTILSLFLTLFFITISNGQTEKSNINTSRSNIKQQLTKPADSLTEKANHNTARSNKNTIKVDENNTIESPQVKKSGSNTNPYFQQNSMDGEMVGKTSKGIDKKDIKRMNTVKDTLQQKNNQNTDDSETSSKKAKKVKFKAGSELSDKVN